MWLCTSSFLLPPEYVQGMPHTLPQPDAGSLWSPASTSDAPAPEGNILLLPPVQCPPQACDSPPVGWALPLPCGPLHPLGSGGCWSWAYWRQHFLHLIGVTPTTPYCSQSGAACSCEALLSTRHRARAGDALLQPPVTMLLPGWEVPLSPPSTPSRVHGSHGMSTSRTGLTRCNATASDPIKEQQGWHANLCLYHISVCVFSFIILYLLTDTLDPSVHKMSGLKSFMSVRL